MIMIRMMRTYKQKWQVPTSRTGTRSDSRKGQHESPKWVLETVAAFDPDPLYTPAFEKKKDPKRLRKIESKKRKAGTKEEKQVPKTQQKGTENGKRKENGKLTTCPWLRERPIIKESLYFVTAENHKAKSWEGVAKKKNQVRLAYFFAFLV